VVKWGSVLEVWKGVVALLWHSYNFSTHFPNYLALFFVLFSSFDVASLRLHLIAVLICVCMSECVCVCVCEEIYEQGFHLFGELYMPTGGGVTHMLHFGNIYCISYALTLNC